MRSFAEARLRLERNCGDPHSCCDRAEIQSCGTEVVAVARPSLLSPHIYRVAIVDRQHYDPTMRQRLVGAKEVAQLLDISRQRVNRIVQTHDEFPRPIGVLAGGRVWNRDDVVDWAQRTG